MMVEGIDDPRWALRLWRTLLVAIAVGLALLLFANAPTGAQAPVGEMAIDCEGNTLELDTVCQFGESQEFGLGVQIVSPPEDGYSAFQAKLRWDDGVLAYQPADRPAEEAVWQQCTLPVRDDDPSGDPPGTSVLFGCVPFPPAEETSRYVGMALLFSFVCVGQGTSDVTLVPVAGGSVLETHFLDVLGRSVSSAVAPATITCGGAEVTRPEPEITPGAESISPEGEFVSPTEQIPAAEAAATAEGRPDVLSLGEGEGAGDGSSDEDGGIDIWVWVLIGVVVIAVVGGLTVGWSRRNEDA